MAALMPDWQKIRWLIPLNMVAGHEGVLAGTQVLAECGSSASDYALSCVLCLTAGLLCALSGSAEQGWVVMKEKGAGCRSEEAALAAA